MCWRPVLPISTSLRNRLSHKTSLAKPHHRHSETSASTQPAIHLSIMSRMTMTLHDTTAKNVACAEATAMSTPGDGAGPSAPYQIETGSMVQHAPRNGASTERIEILIDLMDEDELAEYIPAPPSNVIFAVRHLEDSIYTVEFDDGRTGYVSHCAHRSFAQMRSFLIGNTMHFFSPLCWQPVLPPSTSLHKIHNHSSHENSLAEPHHRHSKISSSCS